MGIDAIIYTHGEIKHGMRERFAKLFGDHITLEQRGDRVYVDHGMRFYDIGYERGPWVTIHSIIKWLQINFESIVFYGGDDGEVYDMTETREKQIWAHWAKKGRGYAVVQRSSGE